MLAAVLWLFSTILWLFNAIGHYDIAVSQDEDPYTPAFWARIAISAGCFGCFCGNLVQFF